MQLCTSLGDNAIGVVLLVHTIVVGVFTFGVIGQGARSKAL
ncbi:hypothetical protein [Arthrobacter sp. D5-1]|nr:hypothetical protein [Arthrobacter sp. D5-1]